jgi:hypothetical protein
VSNVVTPLKSYRVSGLVQQILDGGLDMGLGERAG